MDLARLQDLIRRAMMRHEAFVGAEDGRVFRILPFADSARADPAPEPVVSAPDDAVHAPCFGIVHLTPAPDAPPFVRAGDLVAAGQRVCLVEAMKVFHPVTAPTAGRVAAIFVAAGDEVARGQALLRVDPTVDYG